MIQPTKKNTSEHSCYPYRVIACRKRRHTLSLFLIHRLHKLPLHRHGKEVVNTRLYNLLRGVREKAHKRYGRHPATMQAHIAGTQPVQIHSTPHYFPCSTKVTNYCFTDQRKGQPCHNSEALTAGYHLSAESTSTLAPTPKTPAAELPSSAPAHPPALPPPPSSRIAGEASTGGGGGATGSHFPMGTASNFGASGGADFVRGGGPGGGNADLPDASWSCEMRRDDIHGRGLWRGMIVTPSLEFGPRGHSMAVG